MKNYTKNLVEQIKNSMTLTLSHAPNQQERHLTERTQNGKEFLKLYQKLNL